jgi:hypothetical protein
MSNRGEMWVHGNSVVVQYPGGEGLSPFMRGHRMLNAPDPYTPPDTVPWSDLLGVRSVKGATFRGAFGDEGIQGRTSTNLFHFSIPTPAIFPQLSVPAHLGITVDHVSVYYQTSNEPDVFIQGVSVTDGEVTRNVHAFDSGQVVYGDHSIRYRDSLNSWPIDPLTLELGTAHGVLISVSVRFKVNGNITFTAAGIHYRVGA